MNDAQALFQQGVLTLKNGGDKAAARQLIMASLKQNPRNEMAWLWLARTLDDANKQLECVRRALKLNPNNEQAQALAAHLEARLAPPQPEAPPSAPMDSFAEVNASSDDDPFADVPPDADPFADAPPTDDDPFADVEPVRAAAVPAGGKALTMAVPLSEGEKARVETLLKGAERLQAAGDLEGALRSWVEVLGIRVDHELALQNAVRTLYKLGYADDVKTLIWDALNAGTVSPSVYLTAIDLARRSGEYAPANELADKLARLPNVNEAVIVKLVDYEVGVAQPERARALLVDALRQNPKNQKLLVRMAQLEEESFGRADRAAMLLERAARVKSGSKEGKLADKLLSSAAPILTDRERGSSWMAWREALGVGAAYLVMAWQDAGLNLLALGGGRWLGVALAVIGGFLLVTATSSPQQKPLAAWLGGKVPKRKEQPAPKAGESAVMSGLIEEPTRLPIIPLYFRILLGVVGGIVLVGAFVLVFQTALLLLRAPIAPYIPSIDDLLRGAVWSLAG